MNRWLKRSMGTHDPLRVIKYTNYSNINSADHPAYNKRQDSEGAVELLRLRFNRNNHHVIGKDPNNTYYAFKQKRYSVRKKFIYKKTCSKGSLNNYKASTAWCTKIQPRLLVENNYFTNKSSKIITKNYKFLKKNKHHTDVVSVPLAKRLLRTKRTLVLPAHVNITIITNSYDVVHSWFVPSLGIKLDCVPGRSTHHSLYIDSVGFYYGQCAEICGRYHHHMPIRICALPFEHFLL